MNGWGPGWGEGRGCWPPTGPGPEGFFLVSSTHSNVRESHPEPPAAVNSANLPPGSVGRCVWAGPFSVAHSHVLLGQQHSPQWVQFLLGGHVVT